MNKAINSSNDREYNHQDDINQEQLSITLRDMERANTTLEDFVSTAFDSLFLSSGISFIFERKFHEYLLMIVQVLFHVPQFKCSKCSRNISAHSSLSLC